MPIFAAPRTSVGIYVRSVLRVAARALAKYNTAQHQPVLYGSLNYLQHHIRGVKNIDKNATLVLDILLLQPGWSSQLDKTATSGISPGSKLFLD